MKEAAHLLIFLEWKERIEQSALGGDVWIAMGSICIIFYSDILRRQKKHEDDIYRCAKTNVLRVQLTGTKRLPRKYMSHSLVRHVRIKPITSPNSCNKSRLCAAEFAASRCARISFPSRDPARSAYGRVGRLRRVQTNVPIILRLAHMKPAGSWTPQMSPWKSQPKTEFHYCNVSVLSRAQSHGPWSSGLGSPHRDGRMHATD